MSHEIRIAGQDIAFAAEDGESVLDAAERAGYVMPYSCRKGVCASCEGALVKGEVAFGRTRRLDGPADAVRFCLARPCSDVVVAPSAIAKAQPPQRKRHVAAIHRIDKPAPDVSILHLRLPIGRRVPFHAGQYARVHWGAGESRNYSLANPPHDNDQVQLHIRHVPGGRFSDGHLKTLRAGDRIELELPYGLACPEGGGTAPMILMATGTGFAPLRSIVEDLARRRTGRPVHLFWGGRTEADLYENARVRRWAERLAWFRFTPVLSRAPVDWPGRRGHVQDAVLAEYPDLAGAEVVACGNLAMVEAARALLTARAGLARTHFHADAFLPSGENIEE